MSGIVFSASKEKENLKSKGQYHTRENLALILKQRLEGIAHKKISKVIDICCGSANLLRVFDDAIEKVGFDIEPRFIDHCQKNETGRYELQDALTCLEKSPFIVGNPPFSLRDASIALKTWESLKVEFPDLPKLPNLLDCAFVAKNLECLEPDGKMSLILFPGFLYRGNKERDFREWLCKRGFLVSIEILSGEFFDDTQISIAILCFDRAKTSKEIEFIEKKKRITVPLDAIQKNDFNLSPNRYLPRDDAPKESFNIFESLAGSNESCIKIIESRFKINQMSDMLENGQSANAFLALLKASIKRMEAELKLPKKQKSRQGSLIY